MIMYKYWNCCKKYSLSDVNDIKNYLDKYHIITDVTCDDLAPALKPHNGKTNKVIIKYKKELTYLQKYLSQYDININNFEQCITGFVESAGQSIYYIFDSNILTYEKAEKLAEIIDAQAYGKPINRKDIPDIIKNLKIIFNKIYTNSGIAKAYTFKPSLNPYIKYMKNIEDNRINFPSDNIIRCKWFNVKSDLKNRVTKSTYNNITKNVNHINNLLNI